MGKILLLPYDNSGAASVQLLEIDGKVLGSQMKSMLGISGSLTRGAYIMTILSKLQVKNYEAIKIKKMKHVLFALFFCVIIGCHYDNDENNCTPETTRYLWSADKKITVAYDSTFGEYKYWIIGGNNLVFEYIHTGAQCNNIGDDEWEERLIFETNNGIDEFEYADSSIVNSNCFYELICYCFDEHPYQIMDGKINGVKISDKQWELTVSVTTTPVLPGEQPKTIAFKKIFDKKQ